LAGGSWRVELPVREAPALYPLPPKYRVKVRKLKLLALLIREALHYRFNRRVVLSRPCIYGVFSGRLGGFRPRHDKCVACMRCKQEYPHVIEDIAPDPEFLRLGDSYLTPEIIWTINREATTGGDITRGMGYRGPFSGPGFDAIWTDMSEIVRPTRHGKLDVEYISTRVEIGSLPVHLDGQLIGSWKARLLSCNVPILFDCPPPEAMTGQLVSALCEAAERAGTYALLPWPAMQRSSPSPRGTRAWPCVSAREELPQARAQALELMPRAAGLLPELRPEFDGLLVQRLPFSEGFERAMLEAVEHGADAIHLCADYHGRGLGALSDRPVSELIRRAHLRLVEANIRDRATLIVSGGIVRAEHVIKAILLGADLVAIDTAALAALQLYPIGEARKPDEATFRRRSFPEEWGAQRLTNLLNSWREQMIEIMSAMGIRDVRRLRGEVGRAMFNELEEEFLKKYIGGELDAEGIAP